MRSFLVLVILGSCASAQSVPGPKARELFYTPPPDTTPASKTTNGKTTNNKISAKRTIPPAQQQTGAADPASATAAGSSTHTVAAVPLGVRYSVLKRDAANKFVPVDADATFHAGDRIRLQVQSNSTGYLYVVAQGSSGTWHVLFPSADVAGGSNFLAPGDQREVPGGDQGQFVFDDRGGTEKLFLVLSKQAEPDLDKLIYQMSGTAPVSPQLHRALQTGAYVSNDVVDRVRSQVAPRDLVIEKVDSENAAYVVNPSVSPDARLVVDVALKHQ